jgi:aromatic ring-opening dioxygenase catalytic subunit (LigB family)
MRLPEKTAAHRLPTIFLPHGGGPCFFMDWTLGPADTWKKLETWLRGLPSAVATTPSAILVVSAHWEAEVITLTGATAPELIYDYNGFPEHTYRLQYDVPGDPALAARIQKRLLEAGIESRSDATRGLDHGVFVPLLVAYPDARIPVVELSLRADLDPAHHVRVGEALAPLRDEGVLLVGSGMSYHAMRGFGTAEGAKAASAFDAWLREALDAESAPRSAALRSWSRAPGARSAHPREEHLMPLMVVAGAGSRDRGRCVFSDEIMGVTISAFAFGETAGSRG